MSKYFTTLSYTWGSVVKERSIFIDGRSFKVTKSLHEALLLFRQMNNLPQRLQPTPQETYWWTDAICINQEDIDERNSKVSLMTSLYKEAKMTHVWMGEASENSLHALQLIRELGYEPTPKQQRKT